MGPREDFLQDSRVWLLTRFLVLLPFLSKISFEFSGLVPAKFWLLIFQHGMHPYINVLLCLLAGVPLIFLSFKKSFLLSEGSAFYRLFIGFVLAALWGQSLLQMLFAPQAPIFMSLAAVFLSSFLIYLYGWSLPKFWNVTEFLNFVGRWAQFFVVVSLILWVVNTEVTFKGTRFVGIFKHIPYMVTCATLACSFMLQTLFKDQSFLARCGNISLWALSFWSLLLTGTRSATFAVILSLLVFATLTKARNFKNQFLKFSIVMFAATVVLFFGNEIFEYSHSLIRGEQALAGRQAQDGIKARLDEIERGFESFQESPWLGQGLLSKFNAQDSGELARYDAMKDPHNILVSAGVIGGWGFVVLTIAGLILAIFAGLKGILKSKNAEQKVIALYLLSQIPILIIYHLHLSLGGMADRFYWLVFGFLALKSMDNLRLKSEEFRSR